MTIKMVFKNHCQLERHMNALQYRIKKSFQWQCNVLVVGVPFQNWAPCQIYVLEYKKKNVLKLSMKFFFVFFPFFLAKN